ncbi:M15 family metallopeptidase [Amnibacterium kyonggiense]|uniref:M15 family metallopeptidase n=1 Tax=Amnibacterium kyonggiense TaxID=595671 RepID=UPI001FE48564|nr:M15 family metallopeptidase [Amnibacterium kyonggiense]
MSITSSRRGALLLAGAGLLTLSGCTASAPGRSTAGQQAAEPAPSRTPSPAPFDRTAHSVDAPDSIWLVVNKRRPLGGGYVPAVISVAVAHTNPPLLRREAGAAVVALFAAARRDGIELASNSTYRGYAEQQSIYDRNLRQLGRATADHLTAHPGCSEHQTGLAIDIGAASGRCSLATCMGEMPEGKWLAEHAWRYGFLLRYPSDEVAITGYQYEPWHFRYLGVPLAVELHRTGISTLEEFFHLPAAPDYA